MAQTVKGNTRALPPSALKRVQRLYSRKIGPRELVSRAVATELVDLATEIGRRVGILVGREGKIEEVFLGTRELLYIPDLGRYRFGKGRLRRLRLIFSDLSKSNSPEIPGDIFADLEKLRLDAVVSVKGRDNSIRVALAHLRPLQNVEEAPISVDIFKDHSQISLDFRDFITQIEQQLSSEQIRSLAEGRTGAVLVGVYPKSRSDYKESLVELHELAHTANIEILGEVVQRRTPDPRTVIGKGKLQDTVLQCLRLGAELLIFDSELKPFQWRVITNSTELKVIDRSMLILDIFAQRAKSSAGRLQVELAQLKYNLPRLVEKDVGLSRLTGGIGGRGPGETKLEIGRRRSRDRIRMLEGKIKKLGKQRGVQQSSRNRAGLPLIAIVGYTNAGKSTLFNALTSSEVLVEDKLFATLDTTQRRLVIPAELNEEGELDPPTHGLTAVISDTVGFIRDLPEELKVAFSATLDELYDADLLLHVLDSTDPKVESQFQSVEMILKDMKLANVPKIVVLNKADLQDPFILGTQERDFEALSVSARTKAGFKPLLKEIAERFQKYSDKQFSESCSTH